MPIWRFWLLMVLTIGFYRLFWVVSVARELRKRQDPTIRGWHYVLGLLIGVASPFVAAALTGHIDRNGRARGWEFGPPKWLIVALAVVALVAEFGVARFDEAALSGEISPWLSPLVMLGAYAVFVPLPWALIQHRLNRLKTAFSYPERPTGRYRFSLWQFAVIAIGIVFWPLVVIGSLPDATLDAVFAVRPDGEKVRPHTPITGVAGGYRLTVGADYWVRAEPGALEADADLELLGETFGTWVVVYVMEGEWTLDRIVDFRRNDIRGAVRSLSSNEWRTLLADSAIPVSHARYSGTLLSEGMPATWWVSTVVTDAGAVEVLGSTMDGRAAEHEIESVARSLRLESEAGLP